jgi:hypothetical protein
MSPMDSFSGDELETYREIPTLADDDDPWPFVLIVSNGHGDVSAQLHVRTRSRSWRS